MFTPEQNIELQKQIDPKLTSEREGSKGMKLHYITTYCAIDQANRIFGFDGWSYRIINLDTKTYAFEKLDKDGNLKPAIKVFSTARVLLTAGDCNREDVGHGNSESFGHIPDVELAEKYAVSDALKRALRTFGDRFGNSLYDKDFLQETFGGTGPTNYQNELATEPQVNLIKKLLAEKNRQLTEFTSASIDKITKSQAKEIIPRLQGK